MTIDIMDPLYMGLSALVGFGAHLWNRNGIIWLLGSIIFSPVISGIVLMIAGEKK